jgi:hypothetical protein
VSASAVCAPLRSGSWSGGGVGAFQVGFADPGGQVTSFVHWALEYVAPLNEWVNQLAGNKAQVAQFASTWRGVATSLDACEDSLRTSAAEIAELDGRTGRALRKRHDEIRAVCRDASEWSTATATALELASSIVQAVHDAVVGALARLAGLVTTLFGFTLNPFDKIDQLRQLCNRAYDFIEAVAHLIQQMFDALGRLVALLQSLVPLIVEGLDYLREQLSAMLQRNAIAVGLVLGGPVGGLVGGLLGGAGSDMLASAPRVTELNPNDLGPEKSDPYQAWLRANGVSEIGSLSDLIQGNGDVDLMGGSDRSVVSISEVVKDGQTHWVVALPSTQDWGLLKKLFGDDFADTLKDYPATNDLDSNIALMLMDNPALSTQYERAVMQAMSDAGIPPGANVVYTGFSQGGIMAANLASNEHSPYTTVGVVTNGSPIGLFDIPEHIPVVSFEHFGDPVPSLDGQPIDLHALGPNHHEIVLPTPSDPKNPGLNLSPDNTHNNPHYVDSVAKWQNSHDLSDLGIPDFFSGTVVSTQQHTWGE